MIVRVEIDDELENLILAAGGIKKQELPEFLRDLFVSGLLQLHPHFFEAYLMKQPYEVANGEFILLKSGRKHGEGIVSEGDLRPIGMDTVKKHE